MLRGVSELTQEADFQKFLLAKLRVRDVTRYKASRNLISTKDTLEVGSNATTNYMELYRDSVE